MVVLELVLVLVLVLVGGGERRRRRRRRRSGGRGTGKQLHQFCDALVNPCLVLMSHFGAGGYAPPTLMLLVRE